MSSPQLHDLPFFIIPADCTQLEVIAQGKRGIVFSARYKGKQVAIKIPRPSSDAPSTMLLEATYLKKVNKLGIGPALLLSDEHYVVMEFISGTRIDQFFSSLSSSPEDMRDVLNNVLEQLFLLDKAGINKYELTNPYKHIIITIDEKTKQQKPVLIDFERARHAAKPKNVNQFVQYLESSVLTKQLTGIIDYEQLKKDAKRYQETKEPFVLVLVSNDQEKQE